MAILAASKAMMSKSARDHQHLSPQAFGFIFIGPSGVGKSTLRYQLVTSGIKDHTFVPFRPYTTRRPRPGESEYIFVDDTEFEKLRRSRDCFFANISYGNHFLTRWPRQLEPGQHYIYIYLPEAALQIKRHFPRTIIVQIQPSNLLVLADRIRRRDSHITSTELTARLQGIQQELEAGRRIADIVFMNKEPLKESAIKLKEALGPYLSA